MAGRGQQQAGAMGPQNGPPQQTMQNGGQPYGQTYAPYGQYQPSQAPQQPPMWSNAAPTQPQFGNMGMQNMQQPMMMQQPANNYNLTYNQPLTQQPQANSMDQSAQKPAMPDPVTTTPKTPSPNANITNPITAAQNQVTQNQVAPAPNNNITNPITAAQNQVTQNQVQNPVAPQGYNYNNTGVDGIPPRATGSQDYNSPAVNGVVPRPEGTPDYMKDYTAGPGSTGGITSLLGTMQQEVSPTDYNLSPNAPLMNQGQQNLVNQGLHPAIARLYGSRG